MNKKSTLFLLTLAFQTAYAMYPHVKKSKRITLSSSLSTQEDSRPSIKKNRSLQETKTRGFENNETLLSAAEQGKTRVCSQLLQKGASIEICDTNGLTPLLIAAQKNYYKTCVLFSEKKANVNAQDKTGKNALCFAIKHQNIPLTQHLIKKGADVNLTNEKWPLLILALQFRNKASITLCTLLVENEANLNIQNCFKENPLLIALSISDPEIRRELSTLFITKGVNVNTQGCFGTSQDTFFNTPLYKAFEWKEIDLCTLLINNGARVDTKNIWGDSPLKYAARIKSVKLCLLILSNFCFFPNLNNIYYENTKIALKKESYETLCDNKNFRICAAQILVSHLAQNKQIPNIFFEEVFSLILDETKTHLNTLVEDALKHVHNKEIKEIFEPEMLEQQCNTSLRTTIYRRLNTQLMNTSNLKEEFLKIINNS